MTEERRYGEEEVAAIFEAAAKHSSTSGLSLTELQAIGGEVGIAPERIADAAASLDLRRGARRKTQMGMPVSVGRVVDLPRAPTDLEWEQLLAELRATFGAHGKDRSSGGLRAWTNGNLHAYVEPTETGHRLRLGTMKGNAVALARMGVAELVVGLLMAAFLLATGEAGDATIFALIAMMGAVLLGANALRLPRWAEEREEQMEYIATRTRTLIPADPEPAARPRILGPGD